MTWYAVIDKATGEPVSYGTDVAKELPVTLEIVEIDDQPHAGDTWDRAAKRVVRGTPRARGEAALAADPEVGDILARLTTAEKIALRAKIREHFGG